MGRKPIGKEKKRRVNLMLEPETYEYLRKVGDGNASAGIGVIVLKHIAQDLHDHVKKLPFPKGTKAAQKLYQRDHREYFRQIADGKIDDDDKKYAGLRAWLDGYAAASGHNQ